MRLPLYRSLFCLIALTGLVACNGGAPDPMPRGYSSFDKLHKSVAGQQARNVGYEYSNQKNSSVLQDMRYIAKDLARKLDERLSFSSDEIHLSMPADTAFYNSFDHLLRDELTQRGYLLAREASDHSVSVEFLARNDFTACSFESSDGYMHLYLGLAINVDDKNNAEYVVGGFYDSPTYDYIKAGHVKIETPACTLENDLGN